MDASPCAEQRYKDGLECAKRAVQYDQEGHYSGALSFYSEAVEALNHACAMSPAFSPIQGQVGEYSRRAEELNRYLKSKGDAQGHQLVRQVSERTINRDSRHLRQMEYLLEFAMGDDAKGKWKDAENLYNSAIEFALEAQKKISDPTSKAKLLNITTQAVERVEQLKQKSAPSTPDLDKLPDQLPLPPSTEPRGGLSKTSARGGSTTTRKFMGPLTSFLDLTKPPQFTAYSSESAAGGRAPPKPRPTATPTSSVSGNSRHKRALFSDAEIKLLRATSKINGVVYLPWTDADLAALRAVSPIAQDFCDPVGLPALAAKQKSHFHAWMRPHEMCELPKMVHLFSSFTIKQSIIGDCSFVASLVVCADYERKFKTRLVTRLIHPQNRSGEPIINPHGRYLVSFNLNGCRRKVELDDRLPVGRHGELLCSYSSNADEFWISIIEKAYMKVMGGYDFPGSSSNIDLYALTGWIPERISMKNATNTLFNKLKASLKNGNALITVATGPMSEAEEERAGLVKTYAYAVLNIEEVNGIKLLQLKNPWSDKSDKSWKGNYSDGDRVHWTPELRRRLNYDQTQAQQVDNGVFWIDWKSLQTFYDVIYVNWKPGMFPHKSTIHDVWVPGPTQKDRYDLSSNPQYSLKIHSPVHKPLVWVLLTRHITTKSDFANNEKFIALDIAPSDGKRIYLPDNTVVHGVKINTPHYLAKLEELTPGDSTFTVIVSQLDSLSTIHYTLRAYATCEFTLAPVPNPYHHKEELSGSWRPGEKGSAYFKLTTPTYDSKLLIQLKGPKELFVQIGLASASSSTEFHPLDTGPFRSRVTFMEVPSLPKGDFKISARFVTQGVVPSKTVSFILIVQSSQVFNCERSQ
jgi:calpain-7